MGAVAGQEEEPSVVVVDATADCGEDKKRGYPSGGRPCPRRSAHVKAILLRAQCTRRCCTFLSLSLFLTFRTRLIYWHRSTSATPCYVQDSGCFSPSICHSARQAGRQAGRQVGYTVTALSILLLIRLLCYPYVPRLLLAFELSRDLELSSRIGTRDALRVSFLIPLTLALFSLSLSSPPALSL